MRIEGTRYEGTNPYIFVSYSHNDSEWVHGVIETMTERGYRVWYDRNIEAGKQWTAELADKITGCGIFLPFISHAFANSKYCMQEVRYAHSEGRKIVPVKLGLDRAQYPKELKFLLENAQGFSVDSVSTPKAFATKLDADPLFQVYREVIPNILPTPNFNKVEGTPMEKTQTLTIRKYEEGTENPLQGVRFYVNASNGKPVGPNQGEYTTDRNGHIRLDGLTPGTIITAKETRTIDGYVLDTTPQSIKVGDAQTMTFYNRKSGGVEVIKVDKTDKTRLPNVKFEVHKQGSGRLEEIITGSDGRVYASLEAGDYFLVEVEPADGYKRNPARRYFTVEDGKTTSLTIENKRSNLLVWLMKKRIVVILLLLSMGVMGIIGLKIAIGTSSNSDTDGENPPISEDTPDDNQDPVQYMDTEVSVYAGGGSSFANYAQLYSPIYMDEDGGVLYIWDSEKIRELRPMREDSYEIGDSYPCIDALHVWKGDVYLLTAPCQDVSSYSEAGVDYKFTILRVRGSDDTYVDFGDGIHTDIEEGGIPSNLTDMAVEPFYAGQDMISMRFTDFALSNNGNTLWVIQQDAGIGAGNVMLNRIQYNLDTDRFPSNDMEWFADLQWNVTDNNKPRLAVDDKDNLYISFPEDHCIVWFNLENKEQSYRFLVGNHENDNYQDGDAPTFIYPTSIVVKGDYLYVYDSGAVRRVSLQNGECVTMAGRIFKNGEKSLPVPEMSGEKVSGKEAVFPCGKYPGLAVLDNGTVLLCDSANGVIYRIVERKAP